MTEKSMRLILTFSLSILFSLTANAFTKLRLIITSDLPIEKVEINDYSFTEMQTQPYTDTVNFAFERTDINMYNLGCYINGKKIWTPLWLDTGNVFIKAHIEVNKLHIDTVINSPFYYYVKDYQSKYSSLIHSSDSSGVSAFLLKGINVNINNPFSIWVAMYYLRYNQNNKILLQKLKPLLSLPIQKFSWFRLTADVTKKLDSALTVDRIDLNSLIVINRKRAEEIIQLPDAKLFVLDFWFLNCAPCRKEHMAIDKNWLGLAKKNIQVISISTDANSEFDEWLNYLNKNKYNWANYLLSDKTDFTIKFNINTFPYYLIIDRSGRIVSSHDSYTNVVKAMESMNNF